MVKSKMVIIIDILIVITLVFLFYSSYRILKKYHNDALINNLLDNVTYNNYKNELINLKKINNDIVGILEIENTEYKALFVKGKDNNEYLRRNIYKEKDKNGTAFLDYRVDLDSKKVIIYGHNSRYTNMPFNFLDNYYNKDFYINNKYVNIITEFGIRKYEVISVFTETSDWSYQEINFDNNEELKDNIHKLLHKSIYEEYDHYNDEQILILQTCSTKKEYKGFKRKFLIIVAKESV